jgi:hypothetical protein
MIKSKGKIILITGLIVTIGFLGQVRLISADEAMDQIMTSYYQFSVEFNPEMPGPNQDVRAKIVTYSFDVDRAQITWILNGKVALSGIGEKEFSFKTGDLNTLTTLRVRVIVVDQGKTYRPEQSFSFKASDVDVLWQAENYVPASYKGKALATSRSLIKVTAIPYFSSPASKLIYKWEIDQKAYPELSGIGKNSITFLSTYSSNWHNIRVTVSDLNQTTTAQKRLRIDIRDPNIILYNDHPLEGPHYGVALIDKVTMGGSDFSIRAEPYFFSLKDLKNLAYQWFMNNEVIKIEDLPNIISLRKPEIGSGRAEIAVSINNKINIFQFADRRLTINF